MIAVETCRSRMIGVSQSPDPTSLRKSGRDSRWLWPAVLAVAVVAVFLLDDEISILDNESLRHLSSALWPRNEVFTGGRPLLNFSFAVNHAISGSSVTGYHVTNLFIHAAHVRRGRDDTMRGVQFNDDEPPSAKSREARP